MQLSVEVETAQGTPVFLCKGQILKGAESNYLFDLLTRPERGDVILDLQQVTGCDEEGIGVILLCRSVLFATRRRMLIRNPSSTLLERLKLQQKHRKSACGFGLASLTGLGAQLAAQI